MNRSGWLKIALLLVLGVITISPFAGAAYGSDTGEEVSAAGPAVAVIPVKHTVEQGLQSFLERAFKEAGEAGAEHIVLVVNTLGGRVDSASGIGELIRGSEIPVTAFVEGKAVSAGTYIALNADRIVMQPGSTIGAAAVVNGRGDLIDNPKTISFWVKQMTEAAKLNGRDPAVAQAMVDPEFEAKLADKIGRDKLRGEILSLSATEAAALGYADLTAASVEETLVWLGLDQRAVLEIEPTLAERVARFLVDPIVTTVLLMLGIAGIAIELLVPGFGAPGIVGIVSFGLYFFGAYVAGWAGMESVVLFAVGIGLLALEVFVPSFGILGLLGGASLITAIVIASPSPSSAVVSLLIALAAAAVIVALFARTHRGRGIWNKFILRDKLTTEEGYLSAETKQELVGMEGVSVTPLRPAGTALFGDRRIDVVTSGEYVEARKPVKVVKAEGTWVVVQEILKP